MVEELDTMFHGAEKVSNLRKVPCLWVAICSLSAEVRFSLTDNSINIIAAPAGTSSPFYSGIFNFIGDTFGRLAMIDRVNRVSHIAPRGCAAVSRIFPKVENRLERSIFAFERLAIAHARSFGF